ncbi:MAG: Rieske 2Fe-2S domain-containing protein [Planctomycetaceae bacterium]
MNDENRPGASAYASHDRGEHADEPQWRKDFPIDVPEDNITARREFSKFMVLISFAFFIGQMFIALHHLFRRKGRPGREKIAERSSLAIGETAGFHYPTENDPCLLIRRADNEFVAFGAQCTHLMCGIRPDPDSDRLNCPCHRGYFDAATGIPLAGPPRRPLPRITLEIAGETIYATGVEVRT